MPVLCTREATSLMDLSQNEWVLIARKPFVPGPNDLHWQYTLAESERGAYRRAVGKGVVITVTERKPDGSLILYAKLPVPGRRKAA